MAPARRSARSLPSTTAAGRHGRAVAVSLAGAFAGLAAGTAGGGWGSQAGRGGAIISTSMSSPGAAAVRQPVLASSGVATVLAPASEAGVARGGREDGEEGPP